MQVQTASFLKIAAPTAAAICAQVELSPQARESLLPALSPQGYLAVLIERECYADAVRFLAFALPIREGVWWAVVTARTAEAADAKGARCLACAEDWVYAPDEDKRRACLAAAEAVNNEGAGAYAALAAFWSGGSLAAPGLPDVPPHPTLGPIGVSASVLLAVAAGDPRRSRDRFRAALVRGMDIANGGNGHLEGEA